MYATENLFLPIAVESMTERPLLAKMDGIMSKHTDLILLLNIPPTDVMRNTPPPAAAPYNSLLIIRNSSPKAVSGQRYEYSALVVCDLH